ncbi:MAG: FAD-dependent oxidoreductase [Pseudomonadota bacterium]
MTTTTAELTSERTEHGAPAGSEAKAATQAQATGAKRKLKADLVVIGAGSGGLSAAAGAAMLGLNVVLYEKAEMGGDCLNYGCVPSKALLASAKAAASARDAERFGVALPEPEVDWTKVRAHVQGVIDTIAPVDSQERFEGLGVTVIREAASFLNRKTVVSASTEVTSRRIIIATGSTAFIPPIPGLAETPFLTNETLFTTPIFPAKLIILGGGPIGMEMAQAFNRLGSNVTVIEMGRALGRADADHAALVVDKMRAEGVTILEGQKAIQVTGDAGAIAVDVEADGTTKRVEGTHLLVAVGRRTMLDGLNLEAGGVDFDSKGVVTKSNLRSTSNPKVWALGDAAGREQFTHMAGWHASAFVRSALFKSTTRADSLPAPAVTYTQPEIAQLGLTEAEARAEHGDKIKIGRFSFEENDRAIAERHAEGECKLIIKSGKILGASIVGDGAGDIIQLVSVAMSNGLGVKALTNFISPYPTRAEVVKRSASAYFAPTVFGSASKRLVGLLQRIP